MSDGFKPFDNATSTVAMGDLLVENGTDWIALHGSLDFHKDRLSLERARQLAALFTAIGDRLEAEGDALPDEVQPAVEAPVMVRDPFGEG